MSQTEPATCPVQKLEDRIRSHFPALSSDLREDISYLIQLAHRGQKAIHTLRDIAQVTHPYLTDEQASPLEADIPPPRTDETKSARVTRLADLSEVEKDKLRLGYILSYLETKRRTQREPTREELDQIRTRLLTERGLHEVPHARKSLAGVLALSRDPIKLGKRLLAATTGSTNKNRLLDDLALFFNRKREDFQPPKIDPSPSQPPLSP